MHLLLNEEKCTGCGTCVRVCPQMILALSNKKVGVSDETRCMGCFGCEDECKFQAIRLLRARETGTDIPIEPRPSSQTSCDVVVIGAGPAGLGAAISCAREGLSVIVCERLPNRKLSHHTDGGILFSLPFLTSISIEKGCLTFPELDLKLPPSFVPKKIQGLGFIGPKGLACGKTFPPNVPQGFTGHKDAFVTALVECAEQAGAAVWYNAKVTGYLEANGTKQGVMLADGTEIRSKVVVAADGIQGKMSERAGLPTNKTVLGHAALLSYEYENHTNLPHGLYYFFGDFGFEGETPGAMGGLAISETIHIMTAFFSAKRNYPCKMPIEHYLLHFIEQDKRLQQLCHGQLKDQPPLMRNGCRVLVRNINEDIVQNGLISVGDAYVAGGELGNVPALANGIHTGQVIVKACQRNDFSTKALSAAQAFITPQLKEITTKNGRMKMLPMTLSEAEIAQYFEIMQHFNYPTMMFGTKWQQLTMLCGAMVKGIWPILKYPHLWKYLG